MFRFKKRALAVAVVLLLVGPAGAQYGPNGRMSAVLPGSAAGVGTSMNTRRSATGPYNGFYAVSPPIPGSGGISAVAGFPMASRQFNRTLSVGRVSGFGGVVVATPQFAPVGGGYLGGFNGGVPASPNVNIAVGGSAVFFGGPSFNPTVLVNPVIGNGVSSPSSLAPFGPANAGGLWFAAQPGGSLLSGDTFARSNGVSAVERILARSGNSSSTPPDGLFAGLEAAVPRSPLHPRGTAVAVAPNLVHGTSPDSVRVGEGP